MFTPDDFTMLIKEADDIFNTLPVESRFSFIWKKADVKPLGITWNVIWENVPGVLVPPKSTSRIPTPVGDIVKQDHLELAIPKQYGETITIDGLTYINGIQIYDIMAGHDGTEYRVMSKMRRGYGAYYVLQMELHNGQDTEWLKGQYNRNV